MRSHGVLQDAIAHCQERISEEENLAHDASSPDATAVHSQVVMLYKAHLAVLCRDQRLSGQASGAPWLNIDLARQK
jgi:hypothetical protein